MDGFLEFLENLLVFSKNNSQEFLELTCESLLNLSN